jgi:hypothetical protein
VRRRWAAFAAAFLLALAGCGGSSDDDGGDDGQAGNDPFFGVVSTDAPTGVDLARMSQGGVGSYRVVLSWAAIESVEGQYDWRGTDALVSELARNGIHPLFSIIGTPAAYQPTHVDPPTNDERTFDAWAAFLKAAAERYGPDGDFWQSMADPRPGRSGTSPTPPCSGRRLPTSTPTQS